MVSRARRAILALLSIGLVLAAGEIALRVSGLPVFDACSVVADYAVPDRELGYAPEPGSLVAGQRLNRFGLRGPELQMPKPAAHLRILFIGDSTCWGLGVDLAETFASRVAQALSERDPEHHFEFLLGAFPGYSSYQSKIMLERLLPMDPDLVVFYLGARNDHYRARYYPDAEIPARWARLDAAWHRLRILRLLEIARDRSYRSLGRKLYSDRARAKVPPRDFGANIDAMAAQLERAGVPGLVLVPPVSQRFALENPLAATYREILRVRSLANGLAMRNLQERFAREDPARVLTADGFHLTAAGHAIAANVILESIEADRLLQGSRPRPASGSRGDAAWRAPGGDHP